jgi:putative addiction module component (TIGR02574 family)
MSKALKRLASEVLSLPHGQRAELARALLLSLDSATYEDSGVVEKAWAEEVERRVAELRSGAVQAIPGDQVFKELEDLTN